MTLHFDIGFPFIVGEFLVTALFALCWWDARRRGPGYAGELLGALLFGLLLEYVDVTYITGYHYGPWLVMFGPIPLGVAIGWAVIIYSAMLTSDRLGLPAWAAPFADALLALSIDLAMDAVAIRLGLWVWEWPPTFDKWTAEWLGVPYSNFFGWLMVVLLYSAFSRLFRAARPHVPGWLRLLPTLLFPPLAVALSESILFATFVGGGYDVSYLPRLLGLALIAILISLLGLRYARPRDLPPWAAVAVPVYYHLYFLLALFGPLEDKRPVLFVISLVMLVTGLLFHLWPDRAALRPRLARLLRTRRLGSAPPHHASG